MPAKSLLGYPILRTAQRSLLHGGVRLHQLVADPHELHFTRSQTQKLQSAAQERRNTTDLIDPAHFGMRMQAINISLQAREQMVVLRNQDVWNRFQSNNRAESADTTVAPHLTTAAGSKMLYHTPKKDLRIEPPEEVTRPPASPLAPTAARSDLDRYARFMPLQMAKPMQGSWAPAVRGSGTRSTRGALFQERLDGKGFGWKKKARSLWQQDVDTAGFRPRRYF